MANCVLCKVRGRQRRERKCRNGGRSNKDWLMRMICWMMGLVTVVLLAAFVFSWFSEDREPAYALLPILVAIMLVAFPLSYTWLHHTEQEKHEKEIKSLLTDIRGELKKANRRSQQGNHHTEQEE